MSKAENFVFILDDRPLLRPLAAPPPWPAIGAQYLRGEPARGEEGSRGFRIS